MSASTELWHQSGTVYATLDGFFVVSRCGSQWDCTYKGAMIGHELTLRMAQQRVSNFAKTDKGCDDDVVPWEMK